MRPRWRAARVRGYGDRDAEHHGAGRRRGPGAGGCRAEMVPDGGERAGGQIDGSRDDRGEIAMGIDVVSRPLERGPEAGPVTLTVNGRTLELELEPRVSLLDALREHLGLTGSKKGCDQGTCGACTVWVDGRRVLACLTLAVTCEGREVTTIEGLAADGELHPMQRGVRRARRVPVRLLHAGPDHVGGRAAARGARRRPTSEIARVHERQHLPLRRLSRTSGPRSATSATRAVREHAAAQLRHGSRTSTAPSRPSAHEPRRARSWPAARPRSTWCARTCSGPTLLVDINDLPLTGSRTCPAAACGSARWPG